MRAADDFEHKRRLARERSKRWRRRNKVGRRVGRFHYWDGLVDKFQWTGLITGAEADREEAAEIAVARLLNRLDTDPDRFSDIFRNALRSSWRF